jgi:hypothetical protein
MWQLIPFAVGQTLGYLENQEIGKEGQALAAQGEADYDITLGNLSRIADEVGVGQQSYKLRDTYYQVAEELSKAGVADADELASQMMAGIGDAREEMAAVGKVSDLMKGKRDARLEGAMLKLQGEAGLTKRSEGLEDVKRGMEFNIADTRERDLARINTGMDAYFGSKAATAEQFAAAGNTLSSSLIAASGTPDQRALARTQRQGGGGADGATEEYAPTYDPADFEKFGTGSSSPGKVSLYSGPYQTDMANPLEAMTNKELANAFQGADLEDVIRDQGFGWNTYGVGSMGSVDDFQNFTGILPYGGYQFRQGGYIAEGGGVTEGEFSHDTNKKAIIDEENGQKEGELTGGEVVFNPEQTDKIEDFIESRDANGLLGYMSMLFSLPQFQQA